MAEGYKRSRNDVALANSDPAIIRVAAFWIRRLTTNKVQCVVQYHADQDFEQLRVFWGAELKVPAEAIYGVRKSTSGQLKGRGWRCKWGVLTVRVGDTYLRARLEAWMDAFESNG
jgi:hypothetical protein